MRAAGFPRKPALEGWGYHKVSGLLCISQRPRASERETSAVDAPMKTHRKFWYSVLAGLGMVVLGYAGLLSFMDVKAGGALFGVLASFCALVLLLGIATLVATFGYAVARAITERKR